MKRVSGLLLVVALITGLVGCPAEPEPTPPSEYSLTTASSEGGEVATPGEGAFTYEEGTRVSLVATAASRYSFAGWTGDVGTIANVRATSTTIIMNGDYSITANFQAIPVAKYNLTVSSTEGGSVTAPGQGTFTYDAGTVVELVAEADEGYKFMEWTGNVGSVADVTAASTTATMFGVYSITAVFAKETRTWHDLDAIRDNLSGHYVLVNDLDVTTAGYDELAGPTANGGRGWEPIGSRVADPNLFDIADVVDAFTGTLDGQGYEVRDLLVKRPSEDGVGLLGSIGQGGAVQNLGVVKAEITGHAHVGGLAGGVDHGIVRNCYSSGSITSHSLNVGGLVGSASWGTTVSNSYSTSNVVGSSAVGGLVGFHGGTLDNCYYRGNTSGQWHVGGLVGHSNGAVNNSHSTGSVAGGGAVGGLVGLNNWGTVSNSYYDYDEALINGRRVITIGALFDRDFQQWLANDKFLDVNERLSQEDGYYAIGSLSDFKQLLAFGQDGSLRFRLMNDLDLRDDPNFYIPYLAGTFDGNGHRISNLNLSFDAVREIGLFGFLGPSGTISRVCVVNADIAANRAGVLVGASFGTVSDCCSSGRVNGHWQVGGLIGALHRGTLQDSYSSAAVTGNNVGGLVGWVYGGTVSNSYYNYDEVLINGRRVITIGALFDGDFQEWLANDKFLDVNERLSQEDGYYAISSLSDFKQLLAFGQDGSLKYRLTTDLDLATEPNFYIPYLAGEFDGNGHRIANLRFSYDFVCQVGLFGHLTSSGGVRRVGVDNANVIGSVAVASLVGWNAGTVDSSHASGDVTGSVRVGGLVGGNAGTVRNSRSSGSVVGSSAVGGLVGENWGTLERSCAVGTVSGARYVGGLLGWNKHGSVSNSYSSGSVAGGSQVGGLVGLNWAAVRNSWASGRVTGDWQVGGFVGGNWGAATNSFWDTQASGQATSDGGTGKTTAEMKNIATFFGAGWNIIAVASAEARNISRVWNIVEGQTYPLLSWQPVS